MKARFTVALVLTAGLALSACSGETTSTPSASVSSTAINREASSSMTRTISLENQLKDWWGGQGIPITWKVSETDNSQWDGNSRPDHAPPDGLQGLVQEPFSGPYKDSLEVNVKYFKEFMRSYFVLTPVITIDGQAIELEPTEVYIGREQKLDTAGYVTRPHCKSGDLATASLSKKTPRGLLMYDVVMSCDSQSQQILIRNYQKS